MTAVAKIFLLLAVLYIVTLSQSLRLFNPCTYKTCGLTCKCILSSEKKFLGIIKTPTCVPKYSKNYDFCSSYKKCGYGCCRVGGSECYRRPYCLKPKDPCYKYKKCPSGTSCVAIGKGCKKSRKCVKTSVCQGFKCPYKCKCQTKSVGKKKQPFCEKPKKVCTGFNCGHGCRCLVTGYGCDLKAYCQKPINPCIGYNYCPRGTTCRPYGKGCRLTAICTRKGAPFPPPTRPPPDPVCRGHKCPYKCKCLTKYNGNKKQPYCEKPKKVCSGYNCGHGCKCLVTGNGCDLKAYCQKPLNPCIGYNKCRRGTKCRPYGKGCRLVARCLRIGYF